MSTNSPPVNGRELGSGALVIVVPLTDGVDADVGRTSGVLDCDGLGVLLLVGGILAGVVVGTGLVVTAGVGAAGEVVGETGGIGTSVVVGVATGVVVAGGVGVRIVVVGVGHTLPYAEQLSAAN